ncbi:MFS transporter [Streptomyces cahuitamycinicus]|uniref:MFS transporter n=2 Tax=Streptomyces cahuitamycinicus TaxID=2070367 RepID=A0A2N8TWA0_9ACTN|nr:MFS transporter [Streptomyces cahuitamycinicus]PNG23304.1 MFS transporter [Streptomyces cahuitamycinicus]
MPRVDARIDTSDRPRPRWGVFSRPDFRLLWLGETVSGLGNSITVVALPLIAVVGLDAGSTAVGLLTAAVWLPWLLVGLPVGAWVDRRRKRPLMTACDVTAAAALVSVPSAAWLDALTFQQLVVVALVCGTASVCFSTAYHSYIRIVLDGRDLLEGNAKLQGSEAATQIAGPGVAGLLAQALGAVTALVADAVTFLVSAVCLQRISVIEPDPAPDEERVPLRRQIAEGLRFVGRDRYLRPMVTWGAVINLALMGYQAVQVVFLVRTIGLNPGLVGLLLTSGSTGGLVGALVATRLTRRFGTARGLLLLQLTTSPFVLLLPMTTAGPGLLLFATGSFLVGIGVSVANIVVGTFRQTYCPPHMLGRVVATAMVINHSTIPLGSLLGGMLGDAVGYRPAMWIMTGVVAPSWLILAMSPMRRMRDLPRSEKPERAQLKG